MLTVHHLNQSRSQRVLWALEELQLPDSTPAAKVVTCDSVQAALQSVARPAWLPAGAAWRVQLIASDVDLGGQHSDIRNDQPLDRGKWHFTSRRVH